MNMLITTEGAIYVIAIALQLAGAELLIMSYWSKPLRKLKEEALRKESHYEDEGCLFIGTRTESEIVENILLNRFAFLMIALGYVIGIFGDVQNSCKWVVAVCVIILSVMIAFVVNKVANGIK